MNNDNGTNIKGQLVVILKKCSWYLFHNFHLEPNLPYKRWSLNLYIYNFIDGQFNILFLGSMIMWKYSLFWFFSW